MENGITLDTSIDITEPTPQVQEAIWVLWNALDPNQKQTVFQLVKEMFCQGGQVDKGSVLK